ncbi:MAG: hypothetical protein ACREA0_30550, partial [bacterium]
MVLATALLLTPFASADLPGSTPLADSDGNPSANVNAAHVCVKSASALGAEWEDKTVAAQSIGGAPDVKYGLDQSETLGIHEMWIGAPYVFTRAFFDIASVGTGNGQMEWQFPHATQDGQIHDETNHFSQQGVRWATLTPPTTWNQQSHGNVPDCNDGDGYYYLRIFNTGTKWGADVPQGRQISLTMFNAAVKVVDELDRPVSGLASGNFLVNGAASTDHNKVYDFRPHGPAGHYELALWAHSQEDLRLRATAAD